VWTVSRVNARTDSGGVAGSPGSSCERRLIDGVTRAAAEVGYAALTVERVLAAAAVSRATFYQYFQSLDDCFWAAYREHADWFVGEVACAARDSQDREVGVLRALVEAVVSRPDVGQLLVAECMAAGPSGLTERDRLVARLAGVLTVDRTVGSFVDLPAPTLIGGSLGYLTMRLPEGPSVDELAGHLLEWAGAFRRVPSDQLWARGLAPARGDGEIRNSSIQPGVVGRGPSRERILRATMFAVREKGFRSATVADIVEAAHVSRRHFYNEFDSKAAAFIAAYELGFQRTLEACTPAFFSEGDWPQRVWSSAMAFTGFLTREPLFAHLGFIECYSVGRAYVPRVHNTQLAFTIFLEEGFRQRPEAEGLPRSCAALTAAAIFDLAFDACRRGPGDHMRRTQPLAVYIALAPFVGPDAAGEFVTDMVSTHRRASRAVA